MSDSIQLTQTVSSQDGSVGQKDIIKSKNKADLRKVKFYGGEEEKQIDLSRVETNVADTEEKFNRLAQTVDTESSTSSEEEKPKQKRKQMS